MASQLMGSGHLHPHRYPLRVLWRESRLVTERTNAEMASQAVLYQKAASTVPNMGMSKDGLTKAVKDFQKLIGDLFSKG